MLGANAPSDPRARRRHPGVPPTAAPRVLISRSELDLIGRFTLDWPDLETGGDLFGFYTRSGLPVVTYVLGPGPRARRTEVAFYQDREFLVKAGGALLDRHGLQHLGEWHSHHRLGLRRPSGGDVRTVARARETYALPSFLLGIATIGETPRGLSPELAGYLFARGDPHEHDRCAWVVLPAPSTTRADASLEWIERASEPRTRAAHTAAGPLASLREPTIQRAPLPLRPTSWAATPDGARLIRALLTELSRSGVVRMRPTKDGLLEMDVECARGRALLVWGDSTAAEDANVDVTLLSDEAHAPFTVRGAAVELAARLASALTRDAELPSTSPAGACTRGRDSIASNTTAVSTCGPPASVSCGARDVYAAEETPR